MASYLDGVLAGECARREEYSEEDLVDVTAPVGDLAVVESVGEGISRRFGMRPDRFETFAGNGGGLGT